MKESWWELFLFTVNLSTTFLLSPLLGCCIPNQCMHEWGRQADGQLQDWALLARAAGTSNQGKPCFQPTAPPYPAKLPVWMRSFDGHSNIRHREIPMVCRSHAVSLLDFSGLFETRLCLVSNSDAHRNWALERCCYYLGSILSQPLGPSPSSQVLPAPHPDTPFTLSLLRSKPTFHKPAQRWNFISDFPLNSLFRTGFSLGWEQSFYHDQVWHSNSGFFSDDV